MHIEGERLKIIRDRRDGVLGLWSLLICLGVSTLELVLGKNYIARSARQATLISGVSTGGALVRYSDSLEKLRYIGITYAALSVRARLLERNEQIRLNQA